MTITSENAHLKKKIRTLDVSMNKYGQIINEHAKFINALIAQNKELKRRIENLEFKRTKLIIQ